MFWRSCSQEWFFSKTQILMYPSEVPPSFLISTHEWSTSLVSLLTEVFWRKICLSLCLVVKEKHVYRALWTLLLLGYYNFQTFPTFLIEAKLNFEEEECEGYSERYSVSIWIRPLAALLVRNAMNSSCSISCYGSSNTSEWLFELKSSSISFAVLVPVEVVVISDAVDVSFWLMVLLEVCHNLIIRWLIIGFTTSIVGLWDYVVLLLVVLVVVSIDFTDYLKLSPDNTRSVLSEAISDCDNIRLLLSGNDFRLLSWSQISWKAFWWMRWFVSNRRILRNCCRKWRILIW